MNLPTSLQSIDMPKYSRFLNYRLTSVSVVILLALSIPSGSRATESIPEEALDCLIEPWVVSDVGSSVQGVIAKLMVDRGDNVKRGQPLAQLESGVESLDVILAELRAVTESEIAARQADLKLAKLELSRMQDLHRQNMVSTQQRDESIARYQIANAGLEQATETQERYQLELKRSQQVYARSTLRSPVDGVIVSQSTFPGEFVYDNPVMTIATLDPLRVEVMLPSRLFGTIAVGDQARLYPELAGDAALVSTVDVVDALLDSRSGTFGVRLKIANPDGQIPAGQRCRIMFGPVLGAATASEMGP